MGQQEIPEGWFQECYTERTGKCPTLPRPASATLRGCGYLVGRFAREDYQLRQEILPEDTYPMGGDGVPYKERLLHRGSYPTQLYV